MLRLPVLKLTQLGPLPDEDADEQTIDLHAEALLGVDSPVNDDEACALLKLFGPDECYGLAWTLLHLIETAPGWPLVECMEFLDNEWIDRLRRRLKVKASLLHAQERDQDNPV